MFIDRDFIASSVLLTLRPLLLRRPTAVVSEPRRYDRAGRWAVGRRYGNDQLVADAREENDSWFLGCARRNMPVTTAMSMLVAPTNQTSFISRGASVSFAIRYAVPFSSFFQYIIIRVRQAKLCLRV